MSQIFPTLTQSLDREIRIRIDRRVDAMHRELRYLQEQEDERLLYLTSQQAWSIDRIAAICELNSFYQILLAPLASSARERDGALANVGAVLYGAFRFDGERAEAIKATYQDFMHAMAEMSITSTLLTANRASDIVFHLYKNAER